jgi:hypothetical protein
MDEMEIHITLAFSQVSQIWGNICGGKSASVQPYDHPQHLNVLKDHTHVRYGCGIQFERFYSLNHIRVAWFGHP